MEKVTAPDTEDKPLTTSNQPLNGTSPTITNTYDHGDNHSYVTDATALPEITVNRSRRRVLKALGALGVLGIVGTGTALGGQLDAPSAAGQLTAAQAALPATQVAKLTASNAIRGSEFGSAVSVSTDGTTALVSAFGDTAGNYSGSVYVYDLTQNPPTETEFTASDISPEGDLSFGSAVSVSGDGTTALVGSPYDEAGSDSGSAYVYDLSQNPPTETKLTASDAVSVGYFGALVSVSADGTTALVGSLYDDAGRSSGSAYVYDLTQNPPTETKLTASDVAVGDSIRSLSVSADGTTAFVGVIGNNAGRNSVSVYVYDLNQTSPTETKLTASDVAVGDSIRSLSVSADGTTALVGAPYDAAGRSSDSVYVYDLTQNPPTETKLTASDAAPEDFFGEVLSVSGDGTTILIGAPFDTNDASTYSGHDSGAAYVFALERETFPEPITLPNGQVADPQDLNGDGLYEDLDGDGDVGGQDVSLLTRLENAYRRGQIQLTAAQIAALDFNGDGKFTKADVAAFNRHR